MNTRLFLILMELYARLRGRKRIIKIWFHTRTWSINSSIIMKTEQNYFFTSRNMNSYNGNLGKINKSTAKVLLEWLDKWDIPYDEIFMESHGRGHKGFYVDDRTVRPDEFLTRSVEELDDICRKSKCKN